MSSVELAFSGHAIPSSDSSVSEATASSTAYQTSIKSSFIESDNSAPPPTDFYLVFRPRHQPIPASSTHSGDDNSPYAAAARHGLAWDGCPTSGVDDGCEVAESGDAGRGIRGKCKTGVVDVVGQRQQLEDNGVDGEGGEFDVHGRVL